MSKVQRERVCELIGDFNDEIRAGRVSGSWRKDALKSGEATIASMRAEASYNSYNYCFAGYLQWVGGLIGFKDIVLEPEARSAWRAIKNYALVDLQKEMRGGGLATMF